MCHNERESLPQTLSDVEATIAQLAISAEVLVVDDGSSDGTAEWLESRSHLIPVSIVRHAARRGYGGAVRSGLTAAKGARVAYLDGDGQYDAAQLIGMMRHMDDGFDIVAGVRTKRSDPPHRLVIGALYNAAIRQVIAVTLKDVDCGCKLLSRRTVDTLNLVCDGNLIGAELMGKAHHAGLKILQIPITHRARRFGRPKGADTFAAMNAVRELVTYWAELRPPRT
ncbi:MAG: glycosyltransferase involved in cell wall biosynthesis [Myxococcota bacterium]|jgi:glycosyltransferase involved in cell wall biosynthesis